MAAVGYCVRGGVRTARVTAQNSHGTLTLRIPDTYRAALGISRGDPVWLAPPDDVGGLTRVVLVPAAAPPIAGDPDTGGSGYGWWRRLIAINGRARSFGVTLPPPLRDSAFRGDDFVFSPLGFGRFDVGAPGE